MAGALATPIVVAVASAAWVGYSCVRPEPWVEVRFHDPQRQSPVLDQIVDFNASFTSSGGGEAPGSYRVTFHRGASAVRDRVARDLRRHPAVRFVATGEEHCD